MGLLGVTIVAAGIAGAMTGSAAAGMSAALQRQVAMKSFGTVAKGKVAFSAAIPIHTQAIHDIAQYMGLLFPAGSGGMDTRAKHEIWRDAHGFAGKLDAIAAATPTLGRRC